MTELDYQAFDRIALLLAELDDPASCDNITQNINVFLHGVADELYSMTALGDLEELNPC